MSRFQALNEIKPTQPSYVWLRITNKQPHNSNKEVHSIRSHPLPSIGIVDDRYHSPPDFYIQQRTTKILPLNRREF